MRLAVCILLVLLISCQEKNEEDPNEDKMVRLLIDLQIAEMSLNRTNKDYRDSVRNVYRNQIATLHDLHVYEMDSLVAELQVDRARNKKILNIVKDSIRALSDEYDLKRKEKLKKVSKASKTND